MKPFIISGIAIAALGSGLYLFSPTKPAPSAPTSSAEKLAIPALASPEPISENSPTATVATGPKTPTPDNAPTDETSIYEAVAAPDSVFSKGFDIKDAECNAERCTIKAVAHDNQEPGDIGVIMRFMQQHPEYGTNYSINIGEDRQVSYILSK